MKKSIITILTAMAIASAAETTAQTQCYTYKDEDGNPLYGALRRVSPDGTWAAGGDESDETGSIIVNTADPENPILLPDGLLLDIDNQGMAVGANYEIIGYAKYKRAAIYRDGAWTRLPLPEQIIGQSYAVAISADSRTIAGHAMCENEAPDEPGKYFPLIWKYDDATGEYDIYRLYNNLYLPGTFGFFITDMTPDATVVCGYQCLDMGDIIAAMFNLETEEYTIFHTIDYKEYAWEYLGQTYYSEGMFVDGILDGYDENAMFSGMFNYATDRYLFGAHAVTSNVSDNGTGIVDNLACVYDLQTGQFYDGAPGLYVCGVNPENAISANGRIYCDDQEYDLKEYLGVTAPLDFVYSLDQANKVLGGSFVAYTAWGEPYESPVLVIREDPVFTGIADVAYDAETATVSVSGGVITVSGAHEVAIYNAAGVLVSTSANTPVAPGLYIVTADGVSFKAIVR